MPNPGAVAMGAIIGLGLGVVGAVPFLAIGLDTATLGGQTALLLVGVAAQFGAGYAAARIGRHDHELHGGLAALALFAVVAGISLAGAQEPSLVTMAVGGVVALTMGTLGGRPGPQQSRMRTEHSDLTPPLLAPMLRVSSPGGRGASAPRKVRTPQGTVLGNAQAGKPDG